LAAEGWVSQNGVIVAPALLRGLLRTEGVQMTTIPVKNPRPAAVRDFSSATTRAKIVDDAKRTVRSEEVTLIRRLMRRVARTEASTP